MAKSSRPLILVTASTSQAGVEMLDHSISLSSRYLQALARSGGLPLTLPLTTDSGLIAEAVEQASGVMLSGGDDVNPRIHTPDAPQELVAKCECAEPARDLAELLLIEEVLRQRKPLLAICRGHQLFNCAMGGTLFMDLPTQRPDGLRHSDLERRCEPVHDLAVDPGSRLAKIWRQKSIGVNSTHHQAIDRIADALIPVAVAPDGLIEATELRPEFQDLLPWFASVQFHPERLEDRHPVHRRLFASFVAACGGKD